MPSAAFTTLGCKVNQYETQKILESFEAAGFDIVPFDSIADLYVVNSCSVTSIAESKSRYVVRKASRQSPNGKVIVTGCAAQHALNWGESIDGVDVIVPNPEKMETLRHTLDRFPGLTPERPRDTMRPLSRLPRTRATLKVQDGCDVLCSYCSIPFTRPGMRSRPIDELIEEASRMIAMGYREIVLTGVLIGAYGPETGSGGPRFEAMVQRLAELPGMGRIRISSIEMRQVTEALIDLIRSGLVAPQLHIPLQSGDSKVLADMNRPYSQADYLALCEKLYCHVPGITLTTDTLVGFPTESEAEFLSTAHVFETARFLKAHVFRFSPRTGTPAEAWGDPVTPQEKADRSRRLSAIAKRTGDAVVDDQVGRVVRTLVETKETAEGLLSGLADNYVQVAFAGPASLKRQFAWVRIDESRDGVAYGEQVTETASRGLTLRSVR